MMYSGPGGRGGTTHSLIEDDPVARRLREIGLDRMDAHHVMLAIKRECTVFVTCDKATILKYRAAVEAEFQIRLLLPSELVQGNTTASWLIQAGRSLLEVKTILGHGDIKMTLRYAHLAPDFQRDAVATLDGILAVPVAEGRKSPSEALNLA